VGESDQGEMGPVKITDLARRLGIDKSTVSRALNKRPGVAAKTRERISRVAREMGYSPNVHGQQLRGGKSTTLGLVLGTNVANFEPHFFGPFTLQLYRAASDRGYDLLILSDQHHPDENIADVIARRGSIGSILLGEQSTQVLEAMSGSGIPCVQLDNYARDFPTIDFVTSENQSGSHMATQHLLDLGHCHLSFIGDSNLDYGPGSPAGKQGLNPLYERYTGFRQALAAVGLKEIVADVEGSFQDYVRELLTQAKPPTAIVAVSDSAAADVAEIARAAGIEIPADLSLTGFDDVDSRLVESLQLTTIHVSQAVQAEIAIDIILNHDPGRTERLEHRVATDLIVRTSTAPPSLQSPPGTVLLP
jgi:LacI family transcriptional regulator